MPLAEQGDNYDRGQGGRIRSQLNAQTCDERNRTRKCQLAQIEVIDEERQHPQCSDAKDSSRPSADHAICTVVIHSVSAHHLFEPFDSADTTAGTSSSHARVPPARKCQASAGTPVRHQPKHRQGINRDALSCFSRIGTTWWCSRRESNPEPWD